MPGFAAKTPAEKVFSRIDQRGPDECWPWQGTRNAQGYGLVTYTVPRGSGSHTPRGNDRKCSGAHRIVYEATYGAVPPGMVVLHSCDNPSCCNPRHLVAKAPQPGTSAKRRSEPAGRKRKLSDGDVLAIRALGRREESASNIAARYRISETHVYAILAGKRKAHVVGSGVEPSIREIPARS